MVRGVRCGVAVGLLFMMSAGDGAAGGVMRLGCMAPSWIDRARLEALCAEVAAGLGAALGREMRVVEGGADVALEVIRLEAAVVVARLHWPGAAAGACGGTGRGGCGIGRTVL
ncbi:hypothetical protein [Tabrizicola sp. M-4]|uniref:hypothetical protein n=1 Tax=Tabrizicola sp. M-4 TaxID=3055847 RepID=UPI003DA7A950